MAPVTFTGTIVGFFEETGECAVLLDDVPGNVVLPESFMCYEIPEDTKVFQRQCVCGEVEKWQVGIPPAEPWHCGKHPPATVNYSTTVH